MLRSDVFKDGRARGSKNHPAPKDVYDAVNSVVASRLADHRLLMPSVAEIFAQSSE